MRQKGGGEGGGGAASLKYNKQSAGSIIRPAGKIYVGRWWLREENIRTVRASLCDYGDSQPALPALARSY